MLLNIGPFVAVWLITALVYLFQYLHYGHTVYIYAARYETTLVMILLY